LVLGAAQALGVATLAMLLPSISTFVSLFNAGRGFAGLVKSQHLRAELDGFHFTIERIKKSVEKDRVAKPEEFRAFLEHPATVKLLAQARDDWAVAQMRPNLARLAAVVTGRWERADEELDEDLLLARAAMDVPAVAIALLSEMA